MTSNAYRKRRGSETQWIVAEHLQQNGYPHATPAGAGAPGVDILNVEDAAFEVKARRDFSPASWARQAARNARNGAVPIVILRPDGSGPTTVGSWPCIMPFDVVLALLRGYVGRGSDVGNLEEDGAGQ